MSEFNSVTLDFLIVTLIAILIVQALMIAVMTIRHYVQQRIVNYVGKTLAQKNKQSGLSCPKCDQHFDTYDEFYWHYMNEPTPADREQDIAMYEESWRAVGNDLRKVLGTKK